MKSLEIFSPAKVNLRLEVLAKRDDGYHEIRTLMQRVSLYDRIKITLGGRGICLRYYNSRLPADRENIAWRAAELLLHDAKLDADIDLQLWKEIPVAAGLGGGSSNAASILMGLNKLLKLNYTKERLMDLGARLGADVPFFIYDSPALAEGKGDKLQRISIGFTPWYVLINPPIRVSTRWVYENLNLELTRNRFQFNIPRFLQSFDDLLQLLQNDLETVTEVKYPEVKAIKKVLLEHGSKGALMAGSGPTVFGLFSDDKLAYKAYDRIRSNRGWAIYLARGT